MKNRLYIIDKKIKCTSWELNEGHIQKKKIQISKNKYPQIWLRFGLRFSKVLRRH